MIITQFLIYVLGAVALAGLATGSRPALSKRKDEPNFLNFVQCFDQPPGHCTIVLVLNKDEKESRGVLVFDYQCSMVIGLAKGLVWEKKTYIQGDALVKNVSVAAHKKPANKHELWVDDELQTSVNWETKDWEGTPLWSSQTQFECGPSKKRLGLWRGLGVSAWANIDPMDEAAINFVELAMAGKPPS